MYMQLALATLGANPENFTATHRQTFERDGFVNLGQLLSKEIAQNIVTRLEEIALDEGDKAGTDGFREDGTASLGALVNKDPLFDILFLHPLLLSCVAAIMGDDFGLSSLTSRAALPGGGGQELHWDSSEPCSVNALWILTEFTPNNGPTRIIPGSHVWGVRPSSLLPDVLGPHPEEIHLIAPAGTLVLLNARVWHGGTQNRTNAVRHMASAFFMRRGRYQGGNVDRRLSHATRARFSDAALHILDHEMP